VGVGWFGFVKRLQRLLRGTEQMAVMTDASALLGQLREFTGTKTQAFEFLHLVAQQDRAARAGRWPRPRSAVSGSIR
jgi:hypothetical protein